ncbi:MAG: cadmium resistance transporter [Longimicrobiales bacterium]
MLEILVVSALSVGAYLATNADNFVLLAAMLAQRKAEKERVLLGFGVGVTVVLAASYLIAREASLIPIRYVGLLGLVPVLMGAKGLIEIVRKRRVAPDAESFPEPTGRFVASASALTMMSNSADTLIVLSAILADSEHRVEPFILLSSAGAAVLVASLSAYAVGHPRLEVEIRRIAPLLTPFLLLAVGLYILVNTATDLLPG